MTFLRILYVKMLVLFTTPTSALYIFNRNQRRKASSEEQGYGYFKPLNFLFDTDTQEEVNMLKTLLNDTMTDYSNKFVMGMMDPNSDADWEAYLSALDGCGLQEWNQYYTDYYNANLK